MGLNLDDNFDGENFSNKKKNIINNISPRDIMLSSFIDSDLFAKHFKNSSNPQAIEDASDDLWSLFENYVRRHYGKGETIGAVIFDKDGGSFVSIESEDFDDDEDY